MNLLLLKVDVDNSLSHIVDEAQALEVVHIVEQTVSFFVNFLVVTIIVAIVTVNVILPVEKLSDHFHINIDVSSLVFKWALAILARVLWLGIRPDLVIVIVEVVSDCILAVVDMQLELLAEVLLLRVEASKIFFSCFSYVQALVAISNKIHDAFVVTPDSTAGDGANRRVEFLALRTSVDLVVDSELVLNAK